MKNYIFLFAFLVPMSSYAVEGPYICTGIAEFCKSTEAVSITTNDLNSVCDELYQVSSADLVDIISCLDSGGVQVLKLDRCD